MARFTINDFKNMKNKEKIVMATCYDYAFSKIFDSAGIEVLLVGDSLGMVFKGEENTLNVTVAEMEYHVRSVARGASNAMVIADMPYLSYLVDPRETVKNAGRFIRAGAHAVKLEGGEELREHIAALMTVKIPVLGHLGLTPQSVNALGGFKVQGKSIEDAKKIIEQAKLLENMGVFGIVLEAIPQKLAKIISEAISIPTIGIGAGTDTDGQVLVLQDMLGFNLDMQPKFSRKFMEGAQNVTEAMQLYSSEVKSGHFPAKEHSFKMNDEVSNELEKLY